MLTTPSGRAWVDWKKVMTLFTLTNSPIPSDSILGELRVMLTDKGENQFINCEQFKKCVFWFDEFEGKPSPVLEAMWYAEKMKKKQEAGEESESDDDEG